MKAELYPGGSLGYKSSEAFSVAREGLVDVNEVNSAAAEGECPLPSVCLLPFLHASGAQELVWQIDEFHPVFDKVLQRDWNSKLLFWCSEWTPILFFSKEPMSKLEDFEGKKVRTWGGINDEALSRVGMTPFVIGLPDIYTSLQRGMIDTAITSYMSATECKFCEVLNYVDWVPLYEDRNWAVVNLDAFNALPPDLQDAVMLAGQAATDHWCYRFRFWPQEQLQMMLDHDMEIVQPEPGTTEKFKELIQPMYKEWAAKVNNPDVNELLRGLGVALD